MTIQSSVYRWYRQGTVAVTNGSTAVTGTTTAWSTNVKAGDGFSLDGATWYEVASVTEQIDIAIAELELKSDLSLWPVFRELILLRYEITRAGQAFTADTATLFDVYVEQPRPLLAICAEIYGASQARDLAEQVRRLNRVRTPGRIPAGTTLKMPSRSL